MQRQACYTVGLYTGQFTLYTVRTCLLQHILLDSNILTQSNHYFIRYQTKPNATVQAPAFLHMTVLCCLQSLPLWQIYIYIYILRRLCCKGGIGRAGERKKERKRKGLLLTQPYFLLCDILLQTFSNQTYPKQVIPCF